MTARTDIPIESRLIRAHTYAAFCGLLLSALFGLMVSIKFNAPSFLTGHAAWTWGRLRYDHTQGILYAWLGNAFIAFLYYAVPFLTRHPVTNRRLGWAMFWIWNVIAVLGGWTLVLAGYNQPLEWAEFPLVIAAVIELSFILLIVQFVLPFIQCGASEIYVAGWYLLGGITFTTLAFPLGNLMPHLLPGAMGAAFSGLWIHDAVGLFVTPFGVAIAYFVLPAVTRRPIYSHFYSMIGFWLLFMAYPLNGIHHYILSSLPMAAQHASEVASLYQGVDVILVVTNLLLSIPIAIAATVLEDIPFRFLWTSIVLYLVVSIQGSAQAVMAFNRYIHFTDWVIGHSHLAMIGFASFAAMGGLAHIWQRMPGVRFSRRALGWSYWLLVTGLGLMVADLTVAGLIQAALWQSSLPWIESVRASKPYWLFRTFDGCLLLSGFIVFAVSFLTGPRNTDHRLAVVVNESAGAENDFLKNGAPISDSTRTYSWINTAYATVFGAGMMFFFVSFLALGVFPAIHLHAEIDRTTPKAARLYLSAAEIHGRDLYAKNGCAYCHTEQVRFTAADERRFGPPTQAWETQREFPQMWGTRRIGPDLARETKKHPNDWQLVHLYNPRYIVPDSIMPAYPWMYDGSPSKPTQAALDLVAYLNTLGRAANTLSPKPQPVATEMPIQTTPVHWDEGRQVFLHNCSGCHGANGDGASPGGEALRPVAFNLTGFTLTDQRIWRVLQVGVRGSAMPAWNNLPSDQLRAVAAYTASLGQAPDLAPDKMWAPASVLLEAGRRIYETHCVQCHGEVLSGNGPAANKYNPRPTDFHEVLPSYPAAEYVLHHGVPGSAMAAWPLLTPQEIQAVTYYIRSFYRTPQDYPGKHASTPKQIGEIAP
ncbi:MAG TPA: cbb3-type cytochrome c oxidase subunit I [Acidobacteriaceae bacterium]|jgi:cbb3-type cytochrome oxidase subunit 1/cbb3-type cytochrome oxidase cytochrome c subunit|nr:cbb3-type cytochrome c oxidase subunit I [Acidobacteriaceae bacterium]